MDDHSMEILAAAVYAHTHSTYQLLLSTIQTEIDFVWRTLHQTELVEDETHPLHQRAKYTHERLWQIAYKQMSDECELLEQICQTLDKASPAAAGSIGVIVDCCDEKLNDIRYYAAANKINLD